MTDEQQHDEDDDRARRFQWEDGDLEPIEEESAAEQT